MVNEYTTLALVQAEIRASTAFSSSTTPTSSQVTTWIQEASKEIELRTGMVFGSTLASSVTSDYDGSGIFRFPEKPLIIITKIEYNENELGITPNWLELTDGYDKNFISFLDEGEIEFISGQNATNKIVPKKGNKRLRLTYTYGYNSTPLEIQRLATLLVSKRVINTLLNSQSNTEGGSITVGTISVTDPGSFSISYVKNLNTDIDDLYKNIAQSYKTYVLNRNYD